MLVLRCTRKLLDRVGPAVAAPPASTTLLGDWYAKPFNVGRRGFILLISGATRIAVVMPARDVRNLPRNFPDSLAAVLAGLGIPPDAIEREVEACRDVVVAATDSRSHLGTLGDYANMMQYWLRATPEAECVEMGLWLSDTPVKNFFPVNVARGLFGLGPRQRARF